MGDPARIPRVRPLRGQRHAQRGTVQQFAKEQKPGIAGQFLGSRLHPEGAVAQRSKKF